MLSVVADQPNSMAVVERPRPEPGPGEVRVRYAGHAKAAKCCSISSVED